MTALATVKQLMLIGYIRVSMAREEMISPDIQRTVITDWARRNGYRIVAWIEDLDETGRNFRRKVMRGIERIEQHEAHGIAVYRYDRWGRNAVESLANVQRVELVGGQVLSATEPLDPETAIGRYNRTNAFALAEMQSDIIGENWKAALGNRVSRGLPATGGDRFGYVRKGRIADPVEPNRFRRDVTDPGGERYEPDPKTSPALAEAYRLFVVGNGCNKILKWLNGAGFRSTRGDTFSEQTLFNVMDSGFAAGLLRIHDPSCKCERGVTRCPHVLYVKGAHKPIIDEKMWKDYLARRGKRRKMPPRSRETRYPLTSLIVCGHCQINMTIFYARGESGYGYRCVTHANHRGCEEGAYIRRPIAEQAVRVKLAEWSESLNTVASVARAREETVVQARDLRTDLTRKLTRIDKALSRLVRQRALDEDMPDQVFESARKELLDERSGVTVPQYRRLPAAGRARDGRVGFPSAIVSKLDRQEVDNALNQAGKEISTRFDFRNVGASIAWSGDQAVEIRANSEERAKAVLDVFKDKLVKRGVSLKVLDSSDPKLSGKEYRLAIGLKEGITQDDAKKIAKIVRDEGPKGIRAQVQGDELRVSSKKKDDLQTVIALLKGKEFDFALQFTNYR
jgi:site-specific DNA recombinase